MYLDRAGGEYWACLRSLAQAWADDCLVDQAWLRRFQSADDRQHVAAFWELYVATAYKRTGGMQVQWLEGHGLGERAGYPTFSSPTAMSSSLRSRPQPRTAIGLEQIHVFRRFWISFPRVMRCGMLCV